MRHFSFTSLSICVYIYAHLALAKENTSIHKPTKAALTRYTRQLSNHLNTGGSPGLVFPDLQACATIDALVNIVRELSLGLLSQRELRRMWLRMRLLGQHLPTPDDLHRFFARFDAHRRLLSAPPSHDQLTDTLVSAFPDSLALPVMAKLEDVNINDNIAIPSVPHLWSRLVSRMVQNLSTKVLVSRVLNNWI